MSQLTNVDWWGASEGEQRLLNRFRLLYECARALGKVRDDFFFRPNEANRQRLEDAAKRMAEALADNTTPKKGRPKKRPGGGA